MNKHDQQIYDAAYKKGWNDRGNPLLKTMQEELNNSPVQNHKQMQTDLPGVDKSKVIPSEPQMVKDSLFTAKQAIKQATHDIWFDNLITILTSEPGVGKPDQKYIKDHIKDYLQELTMEGGVAYGIIISLECYLEK